MKRQTTPQNAPENGAPQRGRAGKKQRPVVEVTAKVDAPVAVATVSTCDDWTRPHRTAFAVQNSLLQEPGLDFSSLVVREMPNGVCLEGVVSVDAGSPDIDSLVRLVSGVDRVLNRLVVREKSAEPA
jgi:osmotically-inducible protein OsmY